MACSLRWSPPCQHYSLAGQEHGRTIPLPDSLITRKRLSGSTRQLQRPSLEGKDALPVVFHVNDGPFIYRCGIQGFVEVAERRVPIVSVFALRVGMMDD